MYVFIFLIKLTEWPPIGKIAAHSAYDMFHGISALLLVRFFSHLGFWSGNLFLIAPFPDLCLLVPFEKICEHLATILRENKCKQHSYKCRATLLRMSRDCRTNENDNSTFVGRS